MDPPGPAVRGGCAGVRCNHRHRRCYLPALRPEQVETNVAALSANDTCSTAGYGSRPKERPITSRVATGRLIAGLVFPPNVASLNFASWNQIGEWLRRLDGLRCAA
jgi:hypothetical protein